MQILFIALATALLACWIFLLLRSTPQNAVKLAVEKYHQKNQEISKTKQKVLGKRQEQKEEGAFKRFWSGLVYSEKSEMKNIKRMLEQAEKLKTGKLGLLDMLPLAGYSLLELLSLDSNQPFFKRMVEQNAALWDRDMAVDKTRYQLSACISYGLAGVGLALCVGALLMGLGMAQEGTMMAGIGSLLVAVVAYLPLDGLKEQVEKRQDAITGEFPQAVSKLTLLVGAGIDMTQAWQQTAESNTGVLYLEMSTVTEEIANGISPYQAYNGFIHRCNNKYTSKLGTSIMQNLTKGNEEICVLLYELTSESWADRRQYARRKGELAQSKLLLPTMLMFLGILLLVVAPMMGSFSSTGL